MTEQHHRCRYWPHCSIHTGDPRPLRFSNDNHAEMAELHRAGWTYKEIADAFETRRSTVSAIVTAQHPPPSG